MPKAHKTVEIQVGEHIIDCDREIVELIRTINTIPGINTTNSCQGSFGPGYVMFVDTDKSESSMLFLKHMVELMGRAAKKRILMEERYIPTKGFSLHFTIELGNAYVMRWLPDSYPFVLNAARLAATQMARPSVVS